jgi:putative transcriptional regulator
MARAAFFTGQLLIAMPSMGDPRFAHAVIAIIRHDADGAMGIAIGEASDLTISELLDQAGLPGTVSPDPWVLVGGPVETQRGFVLHSLDWGGEGTIDVAGKFAMSGSLDILRALSNGRGPRDWLVALGYAGWGPGQLEQELIDDAWHVTPADPDILFNMPAEEKWRAVLARDGIDPARIAIQGGSA